MSSRFWPIFQEFLHQRDRHITSSQIAENFCESVTTYQWLAFPEFRTSCFRRKFSRNYPNEVRNRLSSSSWIDRWKNYLKKFSKSLKIKKKSSQKVLFLGFFFQISKFLPERDRHITSSQIAENFCTSVTAHRDTPRHTNGSPTLPKMRAIFIYTI